MDTSQSLRVLIVEDDPVDCRILERLLAQSSLGPCEVQKADSLAGALALLRDCSFDIVLLDLGLPDSQGIESVVRLQAQAPQVPIIVLSGLDDAELATQAVQTGVQDYLIKGQVDANLLTRAIRYAVERKKAECQLLAAELRYRTIFENSAVGIMMVDQQHRLISWNQFTEHLLGLQYEELLGRDVESLYPPHAWRRIRELNLRHKGMQHHLETQMIRGDGQILDVDISLSIVRDSTGGITGSIGVIRDITERRRMEEILDRKQRNLEAVFDAAPLGMLLVNEHLRVVRANDAIRHMSGKEYREMIDHDACQALGCFHASSLVARGPGPKERGTGREPRTAGCEGGGGCPLRRTIEMVLVGDASARGVEVRPTFNHDGVQVQPWLSVSVEPVQIDEAKHVLVGLKDVTDRKRAEEELKDTMEMKSQFLSTVSHELRTPMTSMKEAVVIVLNEIAGKLNKDQKHFLEIAQRNLDRLARLIDDVLDFQKLNAGKMKFEMQAGRIATVVEEACTTMQPQAAKSKVDLAVNLETALPAVVFDSDRIMQLLTNLLSNAIKFTPPGGRVLLSVYRRAEHLVIQVSDTGYGIPKEDLPKLFTQFFRVHRPGKEIKGTGLGLAIVNKIVTGHGGRIEVESELDKGTTFTVFLPLAGPRATGETSDKADRTLERTLLGE